MPVHRAWPGFEVTLSTAWPSPSSATAYVPAVLQPEAVLEALPQPVRGCLLLVGECHVAASACEPRDLQATLVDVALDLDERDGSPGKAAVGPADGVRRILPALVEQTTLGPSVVRQEAIGIRRAVDPAERRERCRPESVDQLAVAAPALVLAEQDEPQRGRVDRAVVGRVGISPTAASSPVRSSWRILPGWASRQSSSSVACRRARTDSVSRAICGRMDSIWMAVMIESRPNKRVVPGDAGRDIALPGQRTGIDQQAQVRHAPAERALGRRVRAGHGRGRRVPRAMGRLRIVAGQCARRGRPLLPGRDVAVQHLRR